MRDPESRNAIAAAPSSALQTHTNASWHLSSPGKRTARAAGSSSSSQQKTIRGHGWGLKFGTAAATRHKLLAIPHTAASGSNQGVNDTWILPASNYRQP